MKNVITHGEDGTAAQGEEKFFLNDSLFNMFLFVNIREQNNVL